MSDDDSEPLVGSHQLLSSIESFSESVTQFLLPIIRYVGQKGTLFDDLERRFSGLIFERRYSQKPAHLVIFEEIPYPLLNPEHALSAEAAYLFCLDEKQVLSERQQSFLRNRISLVLIKPSIEEVIWHIRSLLILQDIAYVNGSNCYVPFLSIDTRFRNSMSTLVAASIDLDSCMVCVGTASLQKRLVDFVFSLHPSVIRPYEFDCTNIDVVDLPDERTSLTLPYCETNTELQSLCVLLAEAMSTKPVIAIVVCGDSEQVDVYTSFPVLDLPSLHTRPIDAKLIAYWCSAFGAHNYDSPMFYTNNQIEDSIVKAEGDPDAFLDSLIGKDPDSVSIELDFSELIDQYDRLAIDDIFAIAEQRVMRNLRERSASIESASNAAGIPKVTFHKRMKRLNEKQSLLGLLSNAQSDD